MAGGAAAAGGGGRSPRGGATSRLRPQADGGWGGAQLTREVRASNAKSSAQKLKAFLWRFGFRFLLSTAPLFFLILFFLVFYARALIREKCSNSVFFAVNSVFFAVIPSFLRCYPQAKDAIRSKKKLHEFISSVIIFTDGITAMMTE